MAGRYIGGMMGADISVAVEAHCELGEGPVWDAEKERVCWTDISAGKIHSFHPASGRHEIIYEGEPVGGFTLQEDGGWLLFRVADIARWQPDGEVTVAHPFAASGMTRFNDVIADPRGRVFAGTIGKTTDSGGLYRVDVRGNVTELFTGTGCANGMGFSPDHQTFYWTCSTTRRLFEFAYDVETGELGGQELLYQAAAGEGVPDGLAVDAEGCLWSARWDGHGIVRHGPDGKVVARLELPVAKVTSLCFGGTNLNQLFITTAGGRTGSNTHEGALFQMPAPAAGMKKFKSRVEFKSAPG
jgi:D-xylono/L-arabinono-1,4-lactonase